MSSLPPTLDFPKAEEEICERWKKESTFATQHRLCKERGDKEYTFYDGPPFATGLPHYGHILAGTIKDVVTRYAVMTGHVVDRRAGWDCHGLPVEYEIDKTLGITHREQVLEMGIGEYNKTCKGIVTRYTQEWERTISRLGRWVDFENDYKTMDLDFMESVWWVFSQLYQKGLVYQGYKVMPYSTACGTPLSNFEANLNYKEVDDPAVVVSFPLVDDPDVSFVAWTTTPWTLPSNLALCVHPTLTYVKMKDTKSSKVYILAKTRLPQLFPVMNNKKKWKPEKEAEYFQILEEFPGEQLRGKRYLPLFDFFVGRGGKTSANYFAVLVDTYVTDDAGTGVVHQAPAFGEDDYRVCLANGLVYKGQTDIPCPVDANGNFTADVPPVAGQHVKTADAALVGLLKEKGRLVQKDVLHHSYPFCWRSDTPLIYKAVPSWFVKVEEIRNDIVENNKRTYWVPQNVQEGRFHNWLADARDWAISRNRFWGTPIPIWANDDLTEVVCIGSLDELHQKSGVRVTDLHREVVDDLTIPSQKNPGTVLRRVDEVFDCWFESGSMPYAQRHYPFEGKEDFEKGFPADFIAEGIDQTRGWFYTLMVLSTALFGKPAFQNLIVNGLVLASDGKKMSKRLKNYPDPNLVISKYGADALRLYLINSPVVRAESLKFQEEGVLGVVKEVFLPLYNALRFLLQNVERWERQTSCTFVPSSSTESVKNPTDVWILAATQQLVKTVHEEMQAYRLYTVMPALVRFGTQLTNWYVRLNRDRLKGLEEGESPQESSAEQGLQVLYDVLLKVSILMAPFTPFLTEYFYQQLRTKQPSYEQRLDKNGGTSLPALAGKSDSVHFLHLPSFDESRLNAAAVQAMEALQSIVELGRNAREKRNISLRMPVQSVVVILRHLPPALEGALTGLLQPYILSELNAWKLTLVPPDAQEEWVKLSLTPNFEVLGKKLGKKMQNVKTAVMRLSHNEAVACMEAGKLVVPDCDNVTLDTSTEVISKLSFAKEGSQWEASSSTEGDVVVAIDTTQNNAIVSAGRSRELMNHVQQLRKLAGLELQDVVEVFFDEQEDNNCRRELEQAVAQNVPLFMAKFKSVPLPQRLAPSWSMALKTDKVDVGGNLVQVSICRPSLAGKDEFYQEKGGVSGFLATLDPTQVAISSSLSVTIDGKTMVLQEGRDYWKSTAEKVQATKALSWWT